MSWKIRYLDEAIEDINSLDKSLKPQIAKMIHRVASNPLPRSDGGYGSALGNHNGIDLSGCFKIKLKKAGIRIVYTLERSAKGMTVVVVHEGGFRSV